MTTKKGTPRPTLIKDEVGNIYGDLTVLHRSNISSSDGSVKWVCLCVCGITVNILGYNLRSGRSTRCKDCSNTRDRRSGLGAFRKNYNLYKHRANKAGIPFPLALSDFIHLVTQTCTYCGRPPYLERRAYNKPSTKGTGLDDTALMHGIDRVDSNKSYLLDNMVTCCFDCNRMKSDFTDSYFMEHIERIYLHSRGRKDNMRKLATYETITVVSPIEDADQIEKVRVRGWDVVVKKDEFAVGDNVVYFEVDSFLPTNDPRFEFLAERGSRKMGEKEGHVLRTIRLRGQISQGLVLPADQFPELPEIEKWEPPLPTGSGEIIGGFPFRWAPKTDSERIQNLGDYLPTILNTGLTWVATEKIDGSSTTVVNTGEEIIVASRNWVVGETDFRYDVLNSLGIIDLLPAGYALQGEVFGENIQNNPLAISGKMFMAFSMYKDGQFVPYTEWPEELVKFRVPVLDLEMPSTVEDFVAQVDKMKSTLNPKKNAEGVVWHSDKPLQFLGERSTFKCINNQFLLKVKD